jgi:hypothetical protein
VKLFVGGEWRSVEIDDRLPVILDDGEITLNLPPASNGVNNIDNKKIGTIRKNNDSIESNDKGAEDLYEVNRLPSLSFLFPICIYPESNKVLFI